MYFALNEFFLQRTQQYTHIKKILSTPLISTIGYEKDITLCKPFHAILNERSKEDFGFGSHLCLLTNARWGDWTLQNQTANQTKVSFVPQKGFAHERNQTLDIRPERFSFNEAFLYAW